MTLGMTLASQSEILDFWFKDTPQARWFASDAAFDETMRARFEETWRAASAGAFASWADTMRGALALVVLLDQFPRNMFRGQASAFSTDGLALVTAARQSRGASMWKHPSVSAAFLSAADAFRGCAGSAGIGPADPRPTRRKAFFLPLRGPPLRSDRRFGRFPARNAALGRESTAEEIEFLKTNPIDF